MYCFGGENLKNTMQDSIIERLNVSSIDHNETEIPYEKYLKELQWKISTPKIGLNKIHGLNFGCCQINTQEILIFGGHIQNKKPTIYQTVTSRSALLLNVKDNTLKFYEGDADVEEKSKYFDVETERFCLSESDTFIIRIKYAIKIRFIAMERRIFMYLIEFQNNGCWLKITSLLFLILTVKMIKFK